MGWLVIVESRAKTFSTSCVFFLTFFARRKTRNIAGTAVQAVGLNAIFPLGTEICKCFGSNNMHISHLVPPHDLQQPLFFSRVATLALTKMSFKLLALLNPIGLF